MEAGLGHEWKRVPVWSVRFAATMWDYSIRVHGRNLHTEGCVMSGRVDESPLLHENRSENKKNSHVEDLSCQYMNGWKQTDLQFEIKVNK